MGTPEDPRANVRVEQPFFFTMETVRHKLE